MNQILFRRKHFIEKIDATDSAVMESGFAYFERLAELREIKLKNCAYVVQPLL